MSHRIVIIGAGGLGTPAAWAIASAPALSQPPAAAALASEADSFSAIDAELRAAAITRAEVPETEIVIIDPDTIELSNLNRQVLFESAEIGRPKAEVLATRLTTTFPNNKLRFTGIQAKIDRQTIFSLLDGAAAILECSDSTESKFIVNDYSVARRIPFVYAGVVGTAGQLLVYSPQAGSRAGCLRCLFGDFTENDLNSQTATCRQAGIAGPVAGQVGILQGSFGVAAILGRLDQNHSQLWRLSGFGSDAAVTAVEPAADCPLGCGIDRMTVLDLRARSCPSTFVYTKLALEQIAEESVIDARYSSAESAANVSRSLGEEGHTIIGSTQLNQSEWRVLIKKRTGGFNLV